MRPLRKVPGRPVPIILDFESRSVAPFRDEGVTLPAHTGRHIPDLIAGGLLVEYKLFPYQREALKMVKKMRGDSAPIVHADVSIFMEGLNIPPAEIVGEYRRGPGKSVSALYMQQFGRVLRPKRFWSNWYVNRGRIPLNPRASDLRRVSWRRVI